VTSAPPRIVCLVGPTASGKTGLGIDLAERLGAEIVSADSRQVYRGMDVGTAKPTATERARVPHHCLDLAEPEDAFDVSRFRDAAAEAIAGIRARGRQVLVVGGTGLWLRVLLQGLCDAPPEMPALRAALRVFAERDGVPALHGWLARLDPPSAARIHRNDLLRIVRALEVALSSGRPLSAWQAEHAFADAPYDALVVGLALPVDELDARIAARVDGMVEAGFVDEVARLAARVPPEAAAWRAVGYREMREHVAGRMPLADAIAATVRATRQFAKRQRTWFRRDAAIVSRDPRRDAGRIADEVAAFLDVGTRPAV
jgi:tRNA dimethylallyltransferase